MEDLGQLIFVVLFILFGLISSSKKKAPQKPRAQSETRPSSGRAPAREEPPSDSPVAQEDPSEKKKGELAEELLMFLQGGQLEPPSEPIVAELEVDDEAQSLETLEATGVESHKRFHEKYVDAAAPRLSYEAEEITDSPVERPYQVEVTTTPQPYVIRDALDGKKALTRRELRHAFVMKEILGPPKALE